MVGVLGLSVDDVIGGGRPQFQAACKKTPPGLPFGKWAEGRGRYCGKDLVQLSDGSVSVSQLYFEKELQSIPISTSRREHLDRTVTTEELAQARAPIGNLSCLARESRPDLSGPTNSVQCRVPGFVVSDLVEINRIIALALILAMQIRCSSEHAVRILAGRLSEHVRPQGSSQWIPCRGLASDVALTQAKEEVLR
jgi:hypothetical protein